MKKIIVALIITIICVLRVNAQVIVTPIQPDGKSVSAPIRAYKTPMNQSVEYSFSQSIYLASDIGTSGQITKLSYYLDSDPNLDGTWKHWQVKIGHIDENEFENDTPQYTSSAPTYVSFVNTVEVFNGDIEYNSSTKKVTINLTKPFQYDGIRNLVVEVADRSSGKYSQEIYFKTKEYSNVMLISASSKKDPTWYFRNSFSKPTKVPVIDITIDSSVTNAPTESSEIIVNSSAINDGSTTDKESPAIYKNYDGDNSWVDMLYHSSKIGRPGQINKISYFTNSLYNPCDFNEAKNQKIYMKEVDYSSHLNLNEPDLSTYTLVYDGSITWKRGLTILDSETIITLNNPFDYSGNKTLAIYFLNENGETLGGTGSCQDTPNVLWDYEPGATLSESYGPFTHYSGSTGVNPKKGVGESTKYLPVMRFYFENIPPVPSAFKTKITATPEKIEANGTATSIIKVQLYAADGSKVNIGGHDVILTTTFGTISSVTDNNNGTYTATLTSSNIEETAIISGKLNNVTITDTASVKFFKNKTKITASPTEIKADGVTTSAITVTVFDNDGNKVTTGGQNVALTTTKGTLGTVTDNNNGTYTALLTSSTSQETAVINGTIDGVVVQGSAEVNFVKASMTKTKITASPTQITADGVSSSTITLKVFNEEGKPYKTNDINVEISGTTTGTWKNIINNNDGTYTIKLVSSKTIEDVTVIAKIDGKPISETVIVKFVKVKPTVSLTKTTLTANPTEIKANGTSYSVITLKVYNTDGTLHTGSDISVSFFAGTDRILKDYKDNEDGTYEIKLISSLTAETVTIKAIIDGNEVLQKAIVKFIVDKDTENESEAITVADDFHCGSSNSNDAPVKYNDYDGSNSWVTMIYKASRIRASGGIRSIAFFTSCRVSSPCNFNTAKKQKIYMKEVDATKFTNSQEPDLSTYTLVYDGSVNWKRGLTIEDSKTIIKLDKPFKYSGKKNLAIYYLNENGKDLKGKMFECYQTPHFLWDYVGDGAIVHESFNDGGKTGNGEIDKYLPAIRFYFDDLVINTDFNVKKAEIVASPSEVKSDGVASSVISVILYNPDGDHLSYDGQNIKVKTDFGKLGDGFVDKHGNYSFHIVSDKDGLAKITGTVDGEEIDDFALVKFIKKPKPSPVNGEGSNTSEIGIYEGFSPNGDGVNDEIMTDGELSKYPNNSLQVFNRHGNLVYKASPYNNDWDGISNGKLTTSKDRKVPIGSYYYIFNTGTGTTQTGWIYINY